MSRSGIARRPMAPEAENIAPVLPLRRAPAIVGAPRGKELGEVALDLIVASAQPATEKERARGTWRARFGLGPCHSLVSSARQSRSRTFRVW